MALSLHEFGREAGCDYTTASRLLSGDRTPSTRLLGRICKAFDLDPREALEALEKDQKRTDGKSPSFAAYLKEKVIDARGGPGQAPRPDAQDRLASLCDVPHIMGVPGCIVSVSKV